MNNIFLNNDPLLYNKPNNQDISTQFPLEYYRQQMIREIPVSKDYLSELDHELKLLDPTVIEQLNQDSKFVQLNQSLQLTIQEEIMNLVRNKLNSMPIVADNIKKQIEVIREISNQTKEKERQNIHELNDYMQNYSHMTFDEYRRIKSGEEITVENKPTKKK